MFLACLIFVTSYCKSRICIHQSASAYMHDCRGWVRSAVSQRDIPMYIGLRNIFTTHVSATFPGIQNKTAC